MTRPDPALVARVRERLGTRPAGHAPTETDVARALRTTGLVVGSAATAGLVRAVTAEIAGAGPVQPLLDDPDVTDVLVNPAGDVWVDRGRGLERATVRLDGPADVRALAVRLAATGGRRLDDQQPAVDARLPDGTRLHAVVAPLCTAGAAISLRTHRPSALGLDDLVAAGAVPRAWRPVLAGLVAQRANVLVSGATGTGKTTLLAALLALVPPGERVVCVEEARELAPRHPHVLHLTPRAANVEGSGAVGLDELVRHALRMRPDRIVLGECRGAEVRDVLLALNTGHDGGMATVHANTASDVPARLEALAALAGLGRDAVAAQAASALDVVLHLRRDPATRVRHVAELGRVGRDERGELVVDVVARWDGRGPVHEGPGWRAAAATWGAADPPGVADAGPVDAGPLDAGVERAC
ncbi:TadA family conjugal transfer-associated ATPase [Luteimicrobium subarcticum]|uniref:Pilus assembly protein CpaF n=1 Tax=Luteimicrobium subarcticum TaxID=620910 RepID=A0A2M8WSF5_9MICO|nr:TadA family conjugal transfer-associated ATPase [Luteimicrobium subarcticum]PJI93871.1 pilus assembly protein CpaF [Luteimicrobium subarcticum]